METGGRTGADDDEATAQAICLAPASIWGFHGKGTCEEDDTYDDDETGCIETPGTCAYDSDGELGPAGYGSHLTTKTECDAAQDICGEGFEPIEEFYPNKVICELETDITYSDRCYKTLGAEGSDRQTGMIDYPARSVRRNRDKDRCEDPANTWDTGTTPVCYDITTVLSATDTSFNDIIDTYNTIEECEKEIIGIWHARCYETDSIDRQTWVGSTGMVEYLSGTTRRHDSKNDCETVFEWNWGTCVQQGTCSSKSGIGNGAAYTTRETCVAASDCGIDSDEPCKWMAGVPFTENGDRNSSPDDCTAAAGTWDDSGETCDDDTHSTKAECINQGTIEQRHGVCIIPGTNIRIENGREQSKGACEAAADTWVPAHCETKSTSFGTYTTQEACEWWRTIWSEHILLLLVVRLYHAYMDWYR